MTRDECEHNVASLILRDPGALDLIATLRPLINSMEVKHLLDAMEALTQQNVKPTQSRLEDFLHGKMSSVSIATAMRRPREPMPRKMLVDALRKAIVADKMEYMSGWITAALQKKADPDSITGRVHEYMETISALESEDDIVTMPAAIAAAEERLRKRQEGDESEMYIKTGFRSMDEAFGGFGSGKLYYIASRPSQGKTALMLNLAMTAAKAGNAVGIITLESHIGELIDRMIANVAKINSLKIERGIMSETEHEKAREGMIKLSGEKIFLKHKVSMTIEEVKAVARLMKKTQHIKILFIDYTQYIESMGDEESRRIAVTRVSKGLHWISSTLGIAVVALAQLNRQADGEPPQLHHLAESSAFEMDGDVVMMISDEIGTAHKRNRLPFDRTKIYVRKARTGMTPVLNVIFNREFLFMEEAPREYEEPRYTP